MSDPGYLPDCVGCQRRRALGDSTGLSYECGDPAQCPAFLETRKDEALEALFAKVAEEDAASGELYRLSSLPPYPDILRDRSLAKIRLTKLTAERKELCRLAEEAEAAFDALPKATYSFNAELSERTDDWRQPLEDKYADHDPHWEESKR